MPLRSVQLHPPVVLCDCVDVNLTVRSDGHRSETSVNRRLRGFRHGGLTVGRVGSFPVTGPSDELEKILDKGIETFPCYDYGGVPKTLSNVSITYITPSVINELFTI